MRSESNNTNSLMCGPHSYFVHHYFEADKRLNIFICTPTRRVKVCISLRFGACTVAEQGLYFSTCIAVLCLSCCRAQMIPMQNPLSEFWQYDWANTKIIYIYIYNSQNFAHSFTTVTPKNYTSLDGIFYTFVCLYYHLEKKCLGLNRPSLWHPWQTLIFFPSSILCVIFQRDL